MACVQSPEWILASTCPLAWCSCAVSSVKNCQGADGDRQVTGPIINANRERVCNWEALRGNDELSCECVQFVISRVIV